MGQADLEPRKEATKKRIPEPQDAASPPALKVLRREVWARALDKQRA